LSILIKNKDVTVAEQYYNTELAPQLEGKDKKMITALKQALDKEKALSIRRI
jgi:hypothetical protein